METNTETGTNSSRFTTRGVLGGAYKATNHKSLLTHLVDAQAPSDGIHEAVSMCRKAKNMADRLSGSDEDRKARPTCETCGKKWDRINGR